MDHFHSHRLLTTADVVAITRLSRSTIWRKRGCGDFPAPCDIGNAQLRWRYVDIEEWIEQLPKYEALSASPNRGTHNSGKVQ